MNPANPRLSRDGGSVVSGFGDLWMNGGLLPVRGQYPGWLTLLTLGYLDTEGFLIDEETGGRIFTVPFNRAEVGGGRWIGTNTAQQQTYVWTGEVIKDSYCPAISPDGAHWACLIGNNLQLHPLLIDGVKVTQGLIDDKLSITDDGTVVYSIFSPLQQTWGKRPGQSPQLLRCTYQAYEVDPVAVQLPSGEIWVVSHDDSRTLVRPWGEVLGYLLPGAKTPHAMAIDNQHLRVVGDLETRLLDVTLDLTLPRTALNIDPDEPPIILPPLPRIRRWTPQAGRAPLPVAVTVGLEGGPCDALRISATGPDVPEVAVDVSDPPAESMRVLRLTRPATYTLHAVAFGPGGTTATEVTNAVIVTPAEEPMPAPQPYPSEPDWWLSVVRPQLVADYAEANKPLNDNYFVWGTRTAYDICAGLTKEASWQKHRNEARAALGLPPL